MFHWLRRWRERREFARELRLRILRARTGPRPPRRSTPPFSRLLAGAARLRDAGLEFEVEVTPERDAGGQGGYRPERVHLFPRLGG